MLTDKERPIVIKYLLRLFLLSGNAPGTVATLLGPEEGVRIVEPVLVQPTIGLWAVALLAACEADGWRVRPPVLYRLLEGDPMGANITPIRERILNPPKGGWAAPSDPVDELVLRTEMPFLDRHGLRDALRALTFPNSKAIVVVTGPSLSGKSYSAQLVDHVSVKLQKFFTARASVIPGTGASMKPFRVAKLLALSMGVTRDPDSEGAKEVDPRSLEALAMWLMAERSQTGRKWWFVLDGFDDPDIPESTHVFLQHLATEATRGISWGNVCLILLGYPKDRPLPNVRPFLIPEELTVDAIGEDELEAYFKFKLRLLGRKFSKTAVTKASRLVIGAVEPGPDRLIRLNEKIAEVQSALLSVS